MGCSARPRLVYLQEKDVGPLPGGPGPESPESALVLPLFEPSQHQVTGFLVVGANPRRVLDAAYQDFFTLVAGQVATAIANARAYEQERRRAEALAELDRTKTAFFSNVSHEFRTPLTLMLGPLEDLLGSAHLSPDLRSQLELIQRSGLRLLKLVNTLLDFSRIEAGRIQASYVPTDLAVLRATTEDPLWIEADAERTRQVLTNYLTNTLKYAPPTSPIEIVLRRTEQQVRVEVCDEGPGIPLEAQARIWERFQRVPGIEAQPGSSGGLGLDLYLCKALIEAQGGQVGVESMPRQGSTFWFTLTSASP